MIIALLTDFGTSDHYVGVMKGVILEHDARIRLVDISHEVPPGRVDSGAFTLLAAYPWFPKGTVHVAVVDPGVGTGRRALVVAAAGQLFVGPDNGLFSYLLDVEPAARVREVREVPPLAWPSSTTFHGRDLFAPVGAALATGAPPDRFGPDLADPVRLPPLRPTRSPDGTVLGRILHVDRFGNCVTSIGRGDLREGSGGVRLSVAGQTLSELRAYYAGAPDDAAFLIWGSSGFLEISVNGGSAAVLLGVELGAAVELRRA